MDVKFEVYLWSEQLKTGEYSYSLKYAGNNIIKAIWNMYKYKKSYGCVKLVWH